MVLIDNVYCFSLHQISTGAVVQKYPAVTVSGRPRSAAFGELNSIVITGGHQGSAYVYNATKSDTPMQILKHTDDGEVHHVTVRVSSTSCRTAH